MFRGEKSKKEKVKIKTQNEKTVETDMNIWHYTYKKQLFESGRNSKNNLQCAFKGPTYARNIGFFVNFFADFWKYQIN